MLDLLSALIVAAAIVWAAVRLARELAAMNAARSPVASILAMFGPAVVVARSDPRALIAWHGLATTARTLFPKEFSALDAAAGGSFPFSADLIEQVHATWTAQWLAWERTHDGECKLKAVTLEHELGELAATPYGRARLDAIEREKLDRYQQRYEEYSRIGRALQGLMTRP